MGHEEQGRYRGQRDRLEVAQWIELHVLLNQRADRECADAAEIEGVAVRWRSDREIRADHAAAARPIIDDDVLAPRFSQLLADDAREDVRGAACRKRENQLEWLRRVGRLLSGCRHGAK